MVHVSSLYVAVLSVVMALLALFYGIALYLKLRAYPVISVASRQTMRRVAILSAVCVTTFLIKAPAILIINSYLCQHDRVSYSTYQVVESIYLLAVDIVPSLLVLWIVGAPPNYTHSANFPESVRRDDTSAHTPLRMDEGKAYSDLSDPMYLPFLASPNHALTSPARRGLTDIDNPVPPSEREQNAAFQYLSPSGSEAGAPQHGKTPSFVL
jgi:hypothetical protein